MVANHNQEEADMDATTVAVDLAKDVFEVAFANRAGRILDRKRLTRRQFERIRRRPRRRAPTVVMEACGTAHYWGRRCQARGLARSVAARSSTCGRTCAATRPTAPTPKRCSKPIAVAAAAGAGEDVEQQTLQALHRVRTQWQAARTARINVVRGLLREQGCRCRSARGPC